VVAVALVSGLVGVDEAFAQAEVCGELPPKSQFGPFDYRDPDPRRIKVMSEIGGTHFTPDIENLVRGKTASLGADIGFMLEHFPNHHRALASMGRLSVREKADKPRGAKYPAECYFDRAIRFRPDDATVRLLYAKFLADWGKNGKAVEQLEEAARLEPDNANVAYNLGLALFELKRYDEAAEQAKKAYAAGFPFPGLRNKLQSVGKWPATGK